MNIYSTQKSQQLLLLASFVMPALAAHDVDHREPELSKQNISASATTDDRAKLIQVHPLTAFAPVWYLSTYPDVRRHAGVTEDKDGNLIITAKHIQFAMQHYLTCGKEEGRAPNPFFNPGFYLDTYSDVSQAAPEGRAGRMKFAYDHWVNNGSKEGRQGSALYYSRYYSETYPDLKRVYGNDYNSLLRHYITTGVIEGRIPSTQMEQVVTRATSILSPKDGNHIQHTAALMEAEMSLKTGAIAGSCNEDTVKASLELFHVIRSCSVISPDCVAAVTIAADSGSIEVVEDCAKEVFSQFIEQMTKESEKMKKNESEKSDRERRERDRENAGGERYEKREKAGRKYA